MDTKWKRSKLIFSFAAFFLGMTLFINSLLSVIGIAVSSGGAALDWQGTYQDTAAFRSCMADYLEVFLGIATGGKGWRSYGTAGQYGDSLAEGSSSEDLLAEYYDILSGTGGAIVQEKAETEWEYWPEAEALEESVVSVPQVEQDFQDWWDNYHDGYWSSSSEKSFMREAARNKNLRYAIVRYNKLLYTNIDGLKKQTGSLLDNLDFEEQLSPEEYNFILWFNKDDDGKTRIFRDGAELEIYGDGMYTPNKRWFVPGYTNFNVDWAAEDTVIFLAAAREPKLYVSGDYSEYGTGQYGGRLYSLYENQREAKKELQRAGILLGASLLLLLSAFFFRKDRRLAEAAVGRLTGKLWLEAKVLLFLILPLILGLSGVRRVLAGILSLLRYGTGALDYMQNACVSLFENRAAVTACFWLLYLWFLDRKANKGQQKKPLVTGLLTGDLALPVQKRMIRRYRLSLAVWLLIPALCLAALFLPARGYLGWAFSRHPLPFLFFVLAYLAFGAAGVFWLKKNRRLAEDLGAFFGQVDAVRNGDLTEPLILPEDTELAKVKDSLNAIQNGLETALQEKLRSEQMKVELVANVSHDIKTPLTSIISYVELLKQEEELPEHVKEFIQILGEKSERLKTIVQDVFEISKAASGQLPVEPENLDLGKLLRQTLADMDAQIRQSRLFIKVSLPEEPVFLFADGQRLYRVFQNLIQNALSYSLEGSRVFLTLKTEGSVALVTIRNTSAGELDGSVDFSERFVRGDASRTDGGSGLGLSIAKSFTEACGGTLRITTDADLFTVTTAFPVCQVSPGP